MNNNIRVLYKKTNKPPEVKIINNVSKLKKAIIKKNLLIIPYESTFIICNDIDFIKNINPNIVLSLRSIYGDMLLINIDKDNRKFKSLSQDDIIWYTEDLINKSYNNNSNNTYNNSFKNKTSFNVPYKQLYKSFERDFESTNEQVSFQKTLISILTEIEHVLIKFLKNKRKVDDKNE